ncbi:MAG TPA: hypothetical protein VM848_10070 [Acidimicrobiia bacterium]|nr:hypothetical protein [Acidimicrobiia bacterium]
MSYQDSVGLERELYTFPEVDRILGLTPGTGQRWINGYERRGTWYDPVVRTRSQDPMDLVTWGEFVETFYLARFRNEGIPLAKLRRIVMAVRERTEQHYLFSHDNTSLRASPAIKEVIHEVQITEDFPTFLVKRTGQMILLREGARERLELIEYRRGVAVALQPRIGLPSIAVAGARFFGKPKVRGTGISPIALAGPVMSGTPLEKVAQIYEVSPRVIHESGKFVYGRHWRVAA